MEWLSVRVSILSVPVPALVPNLFVEAEALRGPAQREQVISNQFSAFSSHFQFSGRKRPPNVDKALGNL